MTGPWGAFGRNLSTALRAEQKSLAAEIIREIRAGIPEFARPLAGQFGAGIQQGVETALAEFADRVEEPAGLDPERLRIYRSLGRGELTEGRSLDALQAAYRLGARVAWRRYARVARRAGLGAESLVTLAEAVFAHIDEIAAASVRGYLEARTDRAGALGRARHHLLRALLEGAGDQEVRRAAAAADWALPDRVAAVVLDPPTVERPRHSRTPQLPDAVLADLEPPEPCLLVPRAYLRDGQVLEALSGQGAVIGPSVPLTEATRSLRWARLLRAELPGPLLRPVDCEDHLAELLLLADRPLVHLIAERRLAPLAELTAKQADRVAATLLAWLQTDHGSAPEVAARLGIHPQTARQRLHRVEELFGRELTAPGARFELEVALRARPRRTQG
ncbi:helix-turn-helix domain-containing protein [Kitasatospora sp. NPDC008050]|uniref:helix-turn-helix domain-containing protein n=1 Tax=Kitasatospora sp. NPDC008050 TaxID=3364021 RepID=UPI0036E7EFBA